MPVNYNNVRGSVSYVSGHKHTYNIDDSGNGWTSLECHPESKSVCHRHRIVNYKILSAKSPCHPFCRDRYGVDGVPEHEHHMQSKVGTDLNRAVKRTSMSKVKNSGNVKQTPLRKRVNRNRRPINSGNTNTSSRRRPIRNTNTSRLRVNNKNMRNRGGGGGNY